MKLGYFYGLGFTVLALCDTLTKLSFKLTALATGDFSLHWGWLWQALHSPWLYVAVLGYVSAFVTWMTLLRHAPVGLAFAASHLELIPVLAFSMLYFDESLHPWQLLGASLIVLGVLCLGREDAKKNAREDAQNV